MFYMCKRRGNRCIRVLIDKSLNGAGLENVSRKQNLFFVAGDSQRTKYEYQQGQDAHANKHGSLHAAHTLEDCRPVRWRWIVAPRPKEVRLQAIIAVFVRADGGGDGGEGIIQGVGA